MFQCIVALMILSRLSQVSPHVILQRSSEARLLIKPSQLFLDAFTGRPLTLICSGEAEGGGTFADFKWLDPRREIIPEGISGVEVLDEKTLKLSFVNPTVENSGTYKCTAMYAEDILEAEISILFREDVILENCDQYQSLFMGDEGEIRCTAVSKRELSITWTKDGKRLETNRFTPTKSGIMVKSVEENDAGLYVIEVFEPTTGTLKIQNITVDVLTRESKYDNEIDLRVTVLNVTADTAYFHVWLSMTVESIEVRYRENIDGTDKEALWMFGDIYAVRNLIPSGRYSFRFRAIPFRASGLSRTKWSEVLPLTLLPAAPEVILRQVNGEMLEIEWIRTIEDKKRSSIDKYQLSYHLIQEYANSWKMSNCNVTIEISSSCFTSVYKMANLERTSLYEIKMKAHTSAGYGDAYVQKVRIA